MATRSAWRTNHRKANPVVAWANIARRIRALSRSDDTTKVFQFGNTDGTTGSITSDHMITNLRTAVKHMGVHTLGYCSTDVGTHSIRSGAAMALVLSGHAAWRIMLTGRWKSSAFLLYIREQVDCFSKGVSARMIEHPDFFHVPDIDTPNTRTHTPTSTFIDFNSFTGGKSTSCDTLDISFYG
jgi:hypothetical protein